MVELDWLVLQYRITMFFVSQFKKPRGTPAFIRRQSDWEPTLLPGNLGNATNFSLERGRAMTSSSTYKGLYLELE